MNTIISGATLFDGTGRAPIENGVLVMEGSRIAAVGSAAEIARPAEAAVIDAEGMVVIPGLIDAHIHLELHGMADTYQENLVEDKLRTLRAAKEMETTLRSGFTAVRNVGSANGIDFAVKAGIAEGYTKGPRIITSGKIITMTCSGTDYFAGMYRVADGVDECRKAAREQLRDGADCLKVMATGAVMNPGGVPGAPQLGVNEMRAVVEEGLKLGKHTAAHAHGAKGIANAVKAGCRTIEHGTMADSDAIKAMADAGAYLVPTMCLHGIFEAHADQVPSFMVEKSRAMQGRHVEIVAEALAAGVKLAIGTDAGTNYNYHGQNFQEIMYVVTAGLMSPADALVTATKHTAEAIQLGDSIGTLEVGKRADAVVLDGDPLADITILGDPERIAMVFKGGRRQF
ncbi:MAG: amidohydrolase family protein [Desulfosarcinaceae bacterium]|nr:amidohydrolase family protein [Desulfosarcinaceae bacterium]